MVAFLLLKTTGMNTYFSLNKSLRANIPYFFFSSFLLFLHSCIVSTGLPDINFFLPKRGKEDISFLIGQPIDCIVDDINTESRTVTLMQRKNNYYDAPLATKSLPFLALSPGMLFEVLVDKKVSTGYIVNYLSLFHGVIDRYSTYKIYSDSEWEELGNKQNTLLARIIFIDHASKTVRLSCRPHIISLRKPTNLPALGIFSFPLSNNL